MFGCNCACVIPFFREDSKMNLIAVKLLYFLYETVSLTVTCQPHQRSRIVLQFRRQGRTACQEISHVAVPPV